MKKKIYGLEVVGAASVSNGLSLTGDLTWRQKPTVPRTKTANYTAIAGDLISFDTAGGEFTITMDAAPEDKDEVGFVDEGGVCDTINLLIDPNGNNILGQADTIGIDMNRVSFTLKYDLATTNWRFL